MSSCRGYRIVKVEDGWRFEFLPINSRTQPVLTSVSYPTEKACRNAILSFRKFIREQSVRDYKSEFVNIIEVEKGTIFEYLSKDHQRIAWHGSTVFTTSSGFQGCIKGIFDNIDEYSSHELTK